MAQRGDGGPQVLVTGVPGSGKSTLARALSDELDLPLLAKDELREVLFDALGTTRHEAAERSRVGLAAIRIQISSRRCRR